MWTSTNIDVFIYRDKAVVTNELKKTQLKLSSIRSDGLTKAQVAEKLLDVERKYRRTKITLDRLKLLIDDVNIVLCLLFYIYNI